MSVSSTKNEFTHIYRKARMVGGERRRELAPVNFLLWDEVAERAFKCCVVKRRGAVMCSNDFSFAMEFYCMNVMKLWPPFYPWGSFPSEEEGFFMRFFRKQGLEPVRFLLPGANMCWWKGVYVSIPEKWYHVDTGDLKREVIEWRISKSGENPLASRSFR
ncbi:MAG: hypothetical protein Q4C86_10550 [bacterium]|nr:hypothetical protein [bacterium]